MIIIIDLEKIIDHLLIDISLCCHDLLSIILQRVSERSSLTNNSSGAKRSEAKNNRADISVCRTMYVSMLSRFRNVIIVSI